MFICVATLTYPLNPKCLSHSSSFLPLTQPPGLSSEVISEKLSLILEISLPLHLALTTCYEVLLPFEWPYHDQHVIRKNSWLHLGHASRACPFQSFPRLQPEPCHHHGFLLDVLHAATLPSPKADLLSCRMILSNIPQVLLVFTPSLSQNKPQVLTV